MQNSIEQATLHGLKQIAMQQTMKVMWSVIAANLLHGVESNKIEILRDRRLVASQLSSTQVIIVNPTVNILKVGIVGFDPPNSYRYSEREQIT